MRVRIIKNAPADPMGASIAQFIGQVFTVEYEGVNGVIDVDFGRIGTLAVCKEEYEIIDVVKELDKFIAEFYLTNSVFSQEIKDFILANRRALCKILR